MQCICQAHGFVQGTEKPLAQPLKPIRCCIHLGMATSQLKSQAEALKGRIQKEGVCRHGGIRKQLSKSENLGGWDEEDRA